MSMQLVGILVILMLANQAIGTGYGSWKSGFSSDLFFRGVRKIFLLFIGYGAIALAAHFAADYIPDMEYLSGILLEPIAKYFIKVCDALKQLLSESSKAEDPPTAPAASVQTNAPAKSPVEEAPAGEAPAEEAPLEEAAVN